MTPDIVIGICTYRRPEGLRRALTALAAVDRPDAGVEVLVVDNAGGDDSAEWVLGEPSLAGFPVRYVHEPRAGLTYARNRAIEESVGSRALVFLDDDETPRPTWLTAMWAGHLAHPRDVVVGPVISELSGPLPEWADEQWPFGRPQHPDGTVVASAGDGNALLPRHALEDPPHRYDHRFAQTGGQDADLFKRMGRAGHRIRWASGAVVDEWIPAERMVLDFTVQRAMWSSASYSYLVRRDGLGAAARRSLSIPRDAGRGALELVGGRLLGRPRLVAHGRTLLARSRGTTLGLRGRLPQRPLTGD